MLNFFTGNLIANAFNTSQSSFNSNSVNTWNSWTSNATMNNMNPQQVDSIGPILRGIGNGAWNFGKGIVNLFGIQKIPEPGSITAESFGIISKDQIPQQIAALQASGQQGMAEFVTENILGLAATDFVVSRFGRLGNASNGVITETIKITDNVAPRTISSFSSHAVNQAITRGFKTSDILKIVREGNPVLAQGKYGPQWRYMLNGNTVIINAIKNRVITVFSNTPGTRNGLGAGFIKPFKQ